MNGPTPARATPADGEVTPLPCPVCQSTATITTAKRPDSDSYWRCVSCGEMWNAARAQYNRRRW
jgi:transposase-like protein